MPFSAAPAAPPVPATVAVGAALLLSTVPSLLPRSAPVQGALSGVLVLAAVGVLALGRLAVGRAVSHEQDGQPARARWIVLAATTLTLLLACLSTHAHLVQRTAALEMPAPGASYWPVAATCALLAVGAGAGLARAAARAARAVGRSSTRRLAAGLLAGATVTTAAGVADVGLLDGLRKELGPDHVLLRESPVGATRTFVRSTEAAGPAAAAELAVDRLVADGGLERQAVVVVLPTGSGWVNDAAVAAIEAELDGDVALVSAQAGDLPSWFYYLFDQEPARRSAVALLGGVLDEVRSVPAGERPDVYVVGESLGALVGQEAVGALPHTREEVCGVLWSGAPGAAVSGHPHERSLLNVDDPIGYLTPRTAYGRPADWPGVWLPLVSYGTTWLDTNTSLRPSDGHGHQYGREQDWSLPRC